MHAAWQEAKREFTQAVKNVRGAYGAVTKGVEVIGDAFSAASEWAVNHEEQLSDSIHLALAAAELVPGMDVVAGVADGALYAVQGDWKDAALSFITAIPGIGEAAAAGRLGAKTADVALKMQKAMRSTFRYAEDGLEAARVRMERWAKRLDHSADAQHAKIHRIRHMLGDGFDTIASRYYDFLSSIKEFKTTMQDRLESYIVRHQGRREELRQKLDEVREVTTMFAKIHKVQDRFNTAMQSWTDAPPAPVSPGPTGPAVP